MLHGPLNVKCVFRFSLQLLSDTFLILRINERDVKKMYICRHVKCPLLLLFSDLNETLIFSADFRKILNYKFHENPSSGSRVVSCGQTDRQT
jgi:hypothetical protein